MAKRHHMPKQQTSFAAKAALLLLAAVLASPVLAAPGTRIPCSKSHEATLNVPLNVLISERVSHDTPLAPLQNRLQNDTSGNDVKTVATISLLAPRAEAAIRDVFNEADSAAMESRETELANNDLTRPMVGVAAKPATTEEVPEPPAEMNTRLPGISDDALSRYKKQMYRRDI